MKTKVYKLLLLLSCFIIAGLIGFIAFQGKAVNTTKKVNGIWSESLRKYRNDDRVEHLVFVQCDNEGSSAVVQLYEKNKEAGNAWTLTLECDGLIGRNGVRANKREGDSATPSGDFGVLTAFGIKANPGTRLSWIDVTDDLWCPDIDCEDYNKIVSAADGGTAAGEHLIEYSPEYNYAMFLDYNTACDPQLGSAIFFHCKSYKRYTGGCVAVDEENMLKILSVFGENDRVIIDLYEDKGQ